MATLRTLERLNTVAAAKQSSAWKLVVGVRGSRRSVASLRIPTFFPHPEDIVAWEIGGVAGANTKFMKGVAAHIAHMSKPTVCISQRRLTRPNLDPLRQDLRCVGPETPKLNR